MIEMLIVSIDNQLLEKYQKKERILKFVELMLMKIQVWQ